MPVEHRLAPQVVFVLADQGRTEDAVVLASTLRRLDLDLDLGLLDRWTPERVRHVADVIGARIWLESLTRVGDQAALRAARTVLTADLVALDPRRRAHLSHLLATALVSGPHGGDPEVLREAGDLLDGVRTQSAILGYLPIEAAALSRLALLQVPTGDLESARRLAGAALSRAGEAARPTYWTFVAQAVDQWARYFQGLATDPEVMAELERSLPRYPFDSAATIVAGTVVALGHMQTGAMPQARSWFNGLLRDRDFSARGIWRLFPLVADAYLAVASGDQRRAREREEDLMRGGAPGEALLVRAVRLAETGDGSDALLAVQSVTARRVRSTGLTYPVACALEAMLLERGGRHLRADQVIRQALGASEPYAARRVFAAHDPAVMASLLRRAAAAQPGNRWVSEILAYVEAEVARAEPPQRIALPSPEPEDAIAPSEPDRVDEVPIRTSPLTVREEQVLALVNGGASQIQVARELFVSLNTVKTHLRSIRHKLGAERTAEAAAVARSSGWLGVH